MSSKVGTLPNIGKYFPPFHPAAFRIHRFARFDRSVAASAWHHTCPKWASSRCGRLVRLKDKGISKGSQMARLDALVGSALIGVGLATRRVGRAPPGCDWPWQLNVKAGLIRQAIR